MRTRISRHAVSAYAASILTLTACASGYGSGPPGGREDRTPPVVVRIVPDSGATRVKPRSMVVEFDGVISERPGGNAATLADLVRISPRDGQPNVDWHRDNITIRPRRGWRANTTYTVTILPGITDLRGNISTTAKSIMFSTGASIPATTVTGTVFDWLTGKPVLNAVVEAVARPDTMLVYVGTTDSLGKFTLHGLTPGNYLVRSYDDQNRNNALDPREAFDSATVALNTTSWTEFLAFAHDTVGPMLSNITVQDSVTLHAFFDTPVDPVKTLEAAAFSLKASDSSRIAITAATPVRADSVPTAATPKPGAGAPNAPTQPAPAAPKSVQPPTPRPSKPLLYREVVITVAAPVQAKATYVLLASKMRGPTGRVATSSKSFTVPAPAAAPAGAPAATPAATPAPRDTTKAPR